VAGFLDGVAQVLLPKGRGTRGGVSSPPRFQASQPIMTIPAYRNHLSDLFSTRTAGDSRTLLNDLVNHDPDVSAAVHAYLAVASSSDMVIIAYNEAGEVDADGIAKVNRLLDVLTVTNDYTLGYSSKPTRKSLLDDHRYMLLLRGSTAMEMVLDKTYTPSELRLVDTSTLRWTQKSPGVYLPEQRPVTGNIYTSLGIPTFFTANYQQNPTDVYTYSPFVSAINTIAARTEVINDLYRIMRQVGFPRLDIEVLEEVLLNNAPPALRSDAVKLRQFVDGEVLKIRTAMSGLTADQTFVHSNAVSAKILNDKNPSAGMQVQGIIDVLDSQNQAALKVMPTVVGKSDNATTASTEARLFAMSADALNAALANILSNVLTFGLRLGGYKGRAEVRFPPVEMRPRLELEPQLTMRAARLKEDLSLGIISDQEYSMEMYGRPPLAGAPELSGTDFLKSNTQAANVDTQNISPNNDSLGRAMAPPGGKSAKSNTTKAGNVK
jgi:hypothetical protein